MQRARGIKRVQRAGRWRAAVACGVAGVSLASGCYRYAYHERSPVGSHDLIAIDRQQVETHSVRFVRSDDGGLLVDLDVPV